MFKTIPRKKKIIPCHVSRRKTIISRASTRQGSYPFLFQPFPYPPERKSSANNPLRVPVTSIKIPAVDEPLFRAIVRRF